MKKNPLILIITSALTSCGQEHKSTSVLVSKEIKTSDTANSSELQETTPISNDKYIDTKHVYVDFDGSEIIIKNSLPKGGLKYTAPNSKEYVYAVFWTQITNKTNSLLELKMGFTESSYQLPSSPDRFFKLFIPSETMTPDKETLFNYGFNLEKYLNDEFNNKTNLIRTVNPKSSNGFYILTLFNKPVNGTLRTELSLNEDKILYRVNDRIIECGKINLKQLKLIK